MLNSQTETLILVKLSNEHLRKSLQDLLAKAVPEIYEETPEVRV